MRLPLSHLLVFAFAAIPMAGCERTNTPVASSLESQQEYEAVSFYRLLAAPEKLDGRKVILRGVLVIDDKTHQDRLYATLDARRGLTVIDSVRIELREDLRQRFASDEEEFFQLAGIFRHTPDVDSEVGLLEEVDSVHQMDMSMPSIESASASYQAEKDYESLRFLYGQLEIELGRERVEMWLGKPSNEPLTGVACYHSDGKRVFEKDENEKPIGLLVDYRGIDGHVTSKVHRWELIPYIESCGGAKAN